MRFSSRFFLYAPLAALLALAAISGVVWKREADALSARLDAANGQDIVPGVRMSFSAKDVGGFPFRLETRLENLKLETANANGPLTWRAEHFAAHALTYGRAQTIFEAAGKQSLQWTDDEGNKRGLEFAVGALRASAIDDKGALFRFDLDVQDFGSPALLAARLQLHLRRKPNADALDVAVRAEGVHLSKGLHSALGDDIRVAELNGQFLPSAPFAPLLAGGTDWRDGLATWRAHQGRMRIDTLSLDWRRPKISGHGELALDAARRPLGVLTLDLSGYRGLVGADKRGIGNALLRLAAQRGAASGTLNTRLVFKDGIAFVGDAPAATVPPLY
jgi:hypothetical protein